eukprot:CAMPEP_0174694686 /NCGR_PEP_ID=MMETSP1094-20130205/1233_1 /TAXON_ID=156173 /ORGANISM="Chrysochromulina brevifilum, Strain UTEX LB 985" /LENGTH=75 /DNA_ID=CAMNT_0015890999 /DNA_START=123 /DNA_END=347 /DNA_ORIENTATION=-
MRTASPELCASSVCSASKLRAAASECIDARLDVPRVEVESDVGCLCGGGGARAGLASGGSASKVGREGGGGGGFL